MHQTNHESCKCTVQLLPWALLIHSLHIFIHLGLSLLFTSGLTFPLFRIKSSCLLGLGLFGFQFLWINHQHIAVTRWQFAFHLVTESHTHMHTFYWRLKIWKHFNFADCTGTMPKLIKKQQRTWHAYDKNRTWLNIKCEIQNRHIINSSWRKSYDKENVFSRILILMLTCS